MSRGFPSMTALLGLLAIAGYQNRDKIAEMLSGLGQKTPGTEGQGGVGGLLSQMGVARRTDGSLQAERPGPNCGVLGQYRAQRTMYDGPT
jgi:uncharacterized protein YidB (DUF937 family)